MYKNAGIENITLRLFDKDRHEILNETDRDDVMKCILAFIRSVLEGK